MKQISFIKRSLAVAAFSVLAATTQLTVAQTRLSEKIGRDNNVAAEISAEQTISRISAEKTTYAVGDSAAVSGQGFEQFEQVTITVEQADDAANGSNLLANWIAVADENGKIDFRWTAPFSGNFRVRAFGSESKNQTQTSFAVAARTMTVVPGNVTCKDLNSSYQQFKIDPPVSKTYSIFTNNTVTAKFYSGEAGLTYLDFQATIPFVAVIVKGGTQGANVYRYTPGQAADTVLTTPNLQDISHVSFCYAPSSVPTAATASVSGSVTSASGRGLPRSLVTIQNLNTEETRTVLTNAFGNYRFSDLPVGNLYSITIDNKKAGFLRQTQSLMLSGDESNINFTATGR
jgi:hypothetical protein